VLERHSEVRSALDRLLEAFAAQNVQNLVAANDKARKALKGLSAVVANEDCPYWLSTILHYSEHFAANHDQGASAAKPLLTTLLSQYSDANAYEWFSDDDQSPDFDVDSIISAAKEHNKVDELFTKLISVLEALSRCEELDSLRASEDLNRVILILNRAKGGTFISQVLSWQFARRFVPNLIESYLKRSDITGPAIEAFEKTADELDIALDKTRDEVAEKLVGAAKGSFKSKAIESMHSGDIAALPNLRSSDLEADPD
jgi:hypothetical protein